MTARFFASVVLVPALLVSPGFTAANAATTRIIADPGDRLERITFRGTSSLSRLSSQPVNRKLPTARERLRFPNRAADLARAARSAAYAAKAVPIPTAPGLPVVPADPDFLGFPGLTDVDQFNAGTGAFSDTQLDVEPPDPELCAGNGLVVDAVNNAVAVYSSRGTRLTVPVALNQFFLVGPEPAAHSVPGWPASQSRCYFDRDTQRWFLTKVQIETYNIHEDTLENRSQIMLAVSRDANPMGDYSVYAIDTTDAPLGSGECPCYGDNTLLGIDANGIFLSFNEYSISYSGFYRGAQIYALSKTALTHGRLPTVVHLAAGALRTPESYGIWTSLQPATAPDTSVANRIRNGTEYFVSGLDFLKQGDKRLAIWALTNTQSLADRIPKLQLQHVVIESAAYSPPPPAIQRAGPAPLATALRAPLEKLFTTDDRLQRYGPLFGVSWNHMSQVVYAGGRLWTGVNTAIRSGDSIGDGIAFFAIAPAFDSSGLLGAKIERQGYAAVAGQNLIDPAIGVNSNGQAVMAATLSGPGYFPTAVYVTPDGKVHLAGLGAGPEDGSSGYDAFYGIAGVALWGHMSAAVADPDGSIWITTEYIPGGQRTRFANWGTFIGHVQIHH